jgi:hypothetical protein
MPIPGVVKVTGTIGPTDITDAYACIDPIYGIDGLRSVANITERNNITTPRRRYGMIVFVQSEQTYYQLDSDLVTWINLGPTLGGGGSVRSGTIAPSSVENVVLGPSTNFSAKKFVLSLVSATKAYGSEIFVSKDHTATLGFSLSEFNILGNINVPIQLAVVGSDLVLQFTNNESVNVNYKIITEITSLGGGDVFGPNISTNNAVVRFDSTTGKIIKGSGVVISDSDDISNVNSLTVTNRTSTRDIQFSPINTPPGAPSNGNVYYDSDYNCLMFYDSTRSKWLSSDCYTFTVSSDNSEVGAGVSLRVSDTPTSTSPILLGPHDVCLVGMNVTTASVEDFTLGVSDVVNGINNYTYSIPSGRYYSNHNLNDDFDANDAIDVFISSLGTSGNVNRPVVTLIFRRRK